jgi:GTP-binding protein
MFVDKARLTLSAGCGGNGIIAWRREKYIPKGGPCGGDGGNGGSIILKADPQVVSLEGFRNRRILNAENGQPGGPNFRKGKNGRDLTLQIPCGTLVKDALTGEILYDFVEQERTETLCKGGKGGKGNDRFKSPTHQAPYVCTEGLPGETREIELELKLIADIGLVGMPNAGKSSLMSQITHLQVKIGAYPFTTLTPNLSYIYTEDRSKILVADIPGIIAGAHQNRGLGFEFLRHIERTSALIYVIDISGFDGRDPIEDFRVLQSELAAYEPALLEKPSLIVLNKIDIEGAAENVSRFREEMTAAPIFEISALEGHGIERLQEAIVEIARPCLQS